MIIHRYPATLRDSTKRKHIFFHIFTSQNAEQALQGNPKKFQSTSNFYEYEYV